MHFNRMKLYWNQRSLSQPQNQFFQPPAAQSPQRFQPPMQRPQVNPGWNQGWGAGQQNSGGQGYSTPGYPPQGLGQQQRPQINPMLNHSYPPQQYTPQGYNQGYGGQMPVQTAWEEPKKGGIKGFLDGIMAKFKR